MHSDLLMNYAFRFFVPTIPLFVILIALLLNYGYKNLRELSQKYKLTHKMFLVLIIYFSVLHLMNITSDLESQVVRAAKYKTLIENVHIPAGKYIFSNFGADKKLLVHADAGAIPYYSRMETIDFGGLNDDYLSQRNKLNDQSMIDYFFDVNADILSITSNFKNKIQRDESSLNWTTLKKTLMEERFGNYTLVKIFETNSWNYYQFVFIKNELLTLYFPEVNTIFQFEGKYNSILLSE
jgi:hypothetical protein